MDTEGQYLRLSTSQVVLMAAAVGIIVANMFYIQPIEKTVTTALEISPATTSVLAMMGQVSYALGLLLLVPLGDLFNRYRFLQVMEMISVLALFLASLSPNALMLGIAIFLIGLTSIGGQIIIPYVAYLTPISEQGPVLGAMISGMLTGILFARTFSGVIASLFGWRAVYGLAAILNLLLLVGLHFVVPDDPRSQTEQQSYGEILRTLPLLVKQYRYLRGAAINAFCLFGLANLLWSTLAFYWKSTLATGRRWPAAWDCLALSRLLPRHLLGGWSINIRPGSTSSSAGLWGLVPT